MSHLAINHLMILCKLIWLPLSVDRPSIKLTATAMCGVLYAVGCYSTAYIPSPWGFGQFRPAVVIPAFFAAVFGPVPAGVGAAIGTLIADSVKHGYVYPGSLIAAVPGNFLGFYLFGYILKKRFTWGRFILTSHLTQTLANLVVAALYVLVYKTLYMGQLTALGRGSLALLVAGVTLWWVVTMLPFVLLVTPPLIRAAANAFPSMVPEEVREHSLRDELLEKEFALSMLVPGFILILLGLLTTSTGLGVFIYDSFGSVTKTLVELMTYSFGVILSIIGSVLLIRK